MAASQGPLIGRERELDELHGMLGDARLVTVTGAGGAGKTRLALELADNFAADERECVIVSLASVAGERELLDALLGALGARERFGSTPMQVLLERAASLRALLLLDNCEHLLEPLRASISELLGVAPHLQVLATSREPLRLRGERVLRLDPLSVPSSDDVAALVRSNAARLFVDRAACADPAFALTPSTSRAVAEICRQLDGLPLAIVLAAARVDTLTVQEIASGLSADGRLSTADGAEQTSGHRSLRASLDWSYRLLSERERRLLRRLSVFSGGFGTSAAAAVAASEAGAAETGAAETGSAETGAAETSAAEAGAAETGAANAGEIRELLEGLRRKQLISRDARTDRWSLLATVVEYAAERLVEAGESEQTADLHMRFFRGYAAHADGLLLEADGHALIDRDRANLRLALLRALDLDRGSALEIAAALMCHWILAEHYGEAHAACASILASAETQDDLGARAIVACGAGLVATLMQDYDAASANTRSGLALAAGLTDGPVKARCLLFASAVLLQTGLDAQQGMEHAQDAVRLARAAEDWFCLAFALVNLAISLMLCGRFDAIERVHEELLQIPRACEHPRLRVWAEHALAWAQINAGSLRRALEHIELTFRIEGDAPSMAHFQSVGFRIHALARIGRTDQAIAEAAEALLRARESGALMAIPAIELAQMVAQFMQGDLDAADARARGLLAMPHLHTLALAHETLGRIALMREQIDEAHAHADHLQALAERFASPRQRALADCIRGHTALQAGQPSHARELLHAALETCAELGLHHDLADVLDALAIDALTPQPAATRAAGEHQPASPGAQDIERAARLAGAASAIRHQFGCIAGPDTSKRLTAALDRAQECEHSERWQTAWKQGQALASAEAVAYARRGRGPRDRPQTGFDSLTPTERQIAKLAADGLTNPQIAAQLFIARGTVKMHLANIYRKLRVGNRVELARRIAESTPQADLRAALERADDREKNSWVQRPE